MKNVRVRIASLFLLLCFAPLANILAMANLSGVKSGDWVRYEFTVAGTSPSLRPLQSELEILRIEGNAIIATMKTYLSIEQWHIQIGEIKLESGITSFIYYSGMGGLAIPCNSEIGYTTNSLTIIGEITKTYAGVSRTTVYSIYYPSQSLGVDPQAYFWDKQTGILLQGAFEIGQGYALIGRVTETNMWSGGGLPVGFEWLLVIILAIVAVVIAVITLVVRFRKDSHSDSLKNRTPALQHPQ